MRSSAPLLIAFALAFACASAKVPPATSTLPPQRVANGAWGGEHVALTVTDAGARLEFDCATGEINQPLTSNAEGHFAATGVFVRERAGALRIGDQPTRQPARYEGHLEGNRLTFDVVLTESNEKAGTFTVERGATPRVRKCR